MGEKHTSANYIFGKESVLPEKEKRAVSRAIKEVFDQKLFQEYLPKEREKTKDELRIISFADDITDELAEHYGGSKLTIPAENIHIVPREEFGRNHSSDAYYNANLQAVIMVEHKSMSFFASEIIHEMIHFKSWGSFRASEKEQNFLQHRVGVQVLAVEELVASSSSENPEKTFHYYFQALNEALTEELTKRLFHEHDVRIVSPEENLQTKELFARYGENDEIVAGSIERKGDLMSRHRVEFSYKSERQMLNRMIDSLYERNQDTFANREEIFDLFARWMFSKSSSGIGKLVDTTFGPGTFRRLAQVPSRDIEKQEEFLVSLQ